MNVAVLGLGFMGVTHLDAWQRVPEANVAAVMSSNMRKLFGDLRGVRGNLSLDTDAIRFDHARKFTAIADVLAAEDIDAVDICLPSHLHAETAIAAFQAGKHVFLEKPMALNWRDTQAIIETGDDHDRKLMVGHVLRYMPPYRRLPELLRGQHVKRAVFRRECGTPEWIDVETSGGEVMDLLIHDLDICISLWGLPTHMTANELHYSGIGPVRIEGGWREDPDYPFSMSYEIETDAGTYSWKLGEGEPIGDPYTAELAAFTHYVHHGGAHPNPPSESALAVRLAEQMRRARNV